MQWTRIKAISRNRDCRIRVISDTSYVIECEGSTWQTDEIVTLPKGFRITASAAPRFHKRGTAWPAGTSTISDRHLRSKRAVVNITGRVGVEWCDESSFLMTGTEEVVEANLKYYFALQ